MTDCGAACLASVAAEYDLHLPVSRIRQYAGTDKRGTNVLGLIEAAEKLGFQAKGARGQADSLSKIPLPAIAHVILKNELHHFVVIYKVSKKHIRIMDPGDGQMHKKTLAEFIKEWTGVVVLLLPDENFQSGNQKHSNTSRFWQLIKPHRSVMLQTLVGAVIYTLLGLSSSIYMQKLIDFVIPEANLRLLNLLSIAMLLILFCQIFIGWFKTVLGLQTGQHIDAKLILGYYQHLLKLPQRFFDTMRVGEIISRINDAVKIRMFINDIALSLVVNSLIVGFSIGLMFLYYWKLATIMLTIVPVYFLLYWISNRVNKKWQRLLMENSADLEAQLVESLNAAGTIKRFGLEAYANMKTENRFVVLLQSIYKSSLKAVALATASDCTSRLFTIIILWTGCFFVIKRELSPGELLSFYALIGYFTEPAASLISANKSMQDALIAADRLFEIIDLETETGNENKMELTPDLAGDIRFHEVHFRYGTRISVFEGLDLLIKKGATTAVVGESGSGKSTLLSLLQNLYPVKAGTITIGGSDIRYISNKSLRERVAVVPQQIDLFAGTIIENIALGDAEPDLKKVITISQMLGIDAFIEKLPATYHTMLSEQGINLSGGQRQRIAIARALYRNPDILILDEATSSLDTQGEKMVQQALALFKAAGKTMIIIAHRLSTVMDADHILVLSEGKLAEQGTHTELMERKGRYYAMFRGLDSVA